ncbi:MAG: hypothetical protein BAJALOKI2v1_250016 [Promethearchaeota archaeon]|nr:MAG: hypothetical protein BAJALOKI2v1_250016 [Candidatus Lokiarchaeota archaeon]
MDNLKDLENQERVSQTSHIYNKIKADLMKVPFILIIGKYDHVLGPSSVYSSTDFNDQNFIRNLLRDALNTKNKFVILNFYNFYSQVFKIDIKDDSARGKKQLYALILLRHNESPLIPAVHFKRIGMLFRKIGNDLILKDEQERFQEFYNQISEIYLNKNEILPLESCNLQIRSAVNTIQGFCELILEEKKKKGKIQEGSISSYLQMMLDSCDDIMKAVEENLKSNLK